MEGGRWYSLSPDALSLQLQAGRDQGGQLPGVSGGRRVRTAEEGDPGQAHGSRLLP